MEKEKTLLSEIVAEAYDAADRPFDYLEENVVTALVCESNPVTRDKIVSKLMEMGYQITSPFTAKEALKNMLFHIYNVVIINELFDADTPEGNQVLSYLASLAMSTRRQIFVTLVGNRYRTMDNMTAFNQSVNLVINMKNLDDIGTILRGAIKDNNNFYFVFKEALRNKGRM
jgi:hypothetical protein